MDKKEIISKLQSIFKKFFDDSSLKLKTDLSAKDVAGWDSLNHVRLIFEIENFFNIKFFNSEINNTENVGELVDIIYSRLSDKQK